MQRWGFLVAGSLTDEECGHALFKRVELKFTTSERERLDSALADLIELVIWSPKNAKAWCAVEDKHVVLLVFSSSKPFYIIV